jgi:hypothetical protein
MAISTTAAQPSALARVVADHLAAMLSAQPEPPRQLTGPLWALVEAPLTATPRALATIRTIMADPNNRAALLDLRSQLVVLLREDPTLRRRVAAYLGSGHVEEPAATEEPGAATTPRDNVVAPGSELTSVYLDGQAGQQTTGPARLFQARLEPPDPERPALVTLAVGVGSSGLGVALHDRSLFAAGEDEVVLETIVTSRDFEVLDSGRRALRLPRTGPSRNLARFDLAVPDGVKTGEATALLYKAGNFVAGMVIRVRVAPDDRGITEVQTLGRPLGAAATLRTRQLSLVIRPDGREYTLTAFGALSGQVPLRLTDTHLEHLLTEARQALKQLVDLPDYQDSVSIGAGLFRSSLAALAEAGIKLYRALFYTGDVAAEDFGDRLRAAASRENLKIQVVSDRFILPWGLLYLADEFNREHVDPECFLGFRHIVEHLLLRRTPDVPLEMATSPRLSVACAFDVDIDHDLAVSAVAEQISFWNALHQATAGSANAIDLWTASTAGQVHEALTDSGRAAHLWYFYCHAVTGATADDAYLQLSDGSRLTLRELSLGTRSALPGAPLVLLNACGSATLGPMFYAGFLPYFTGRGARGMIGTECDVPAILAAEWARRFFSAFLRGGRTLGEVLLDLRRDLLQEHRNPLGLVYAMYCDADTTAVPGVRVT